MRDKNRIRPFMKQLEELWLTMPDIRFGQLLINLTYQSNIPLHVIEDDYVLKFIEDELQTKKTKE